MTQNQHKQLENSTQNQAKPTGKPNSKSIQTHRKTIPNPTKIKTKPKSAQTHTDVAVAAAMSEKVKNQTSNLSKNAENGLGLTWACVEVKFGVLFMGIFGEERGEEEEKIDR